MPPRRIGTSNDEIYQPQRGIWDDLNVRAVVEILKRFPMLAKRPRLNDDTLAVGPKLPADNTPLERKAYINGMLES